jgi:hypothetical protein
MQASRLASDLANGSRKEREIEMSLIGLASICGVTSSSLKDLMKGRVGVGIAGRLGVTSSSLQKFVDGGTSIGLASELGILSSNLQELRDSIGREGAIGFLIGVAAAKPNAE